MTTGKAEGMTGTSKAKTKTRKKLKTKYTE